MNGSIQEAIDKLYLDMTWGGEPAEASLYQYTRISENFLSSLDHFPPNTDDVKLWIQPLETANWKRFNYYILKKLFAANRWPWDIRRPPKKDEVHPPTLDYGTVAYLIEARDLLDEREQAYLALSTTYGFRRAEIANMTQENLNGQLIVATKKGGRVRTHKIPEEIEPVLKSYEFKPIERSWLNRIFQRMFRRVGLEYEPKHSMHAIRASLISHLSLNGVNDSIITKFMGWKVMPTGAGISQMLGVYTRPPEENVDDLVFDHHPFVNLWGGE